MIEVTTHIEFPEQIKTKLNSYVTDEFGHIPIVIETEWAIPDWTIVYYENDLIATFCNIVEREILIDNRIFRVGGINNVITPKEFRGRGYASQLIKKAEHLLFDDLNCDLGVLLCADDLLPFYERLHWYKVDCPVYFEQSNRVKLWRANTMLLTKDEKMNPQRIELNGLPW